MARSSRWPAWRRARRRVDRLRILQWMTVLVPAICAGLYETVRHTLLAKELPNALGTLLAVALVLAISSIFARVAFGLIRQSEARLRERNRELQALSREVQRLTLIEERDRLAREMHDSVAQVLAYLLVRLDTIERLLERGRTGEAALEVRRLRGSAEGAYAGVREAIAGLRTRPSAGAAGLAAALEQYVREFGDRIGIDAVFAAEGIPATTGGADDLAPAAEMQLLRIAQEALANVRKHARATRVLVKLCRAPAGWRLIVRDDGAGFDPQMAEHPRAASGPGTHAGHFGLAMMRERAHSLGGELVVSSQPAGGTTIDVLIPAGAAPAAEPRPAPTAAVLAVPGAGSEESEGVAARGSEWKKPARLMET